MGYLTKMEQNGDTQILEYPKPKSSTYLGKFEEDKEKFPGKILYIKQGLLKKSYFFKRTKGFYRGPVIDINMGRKKSLEETIKSEQIYVSRFEKEGKVRTWSYIFGQTVFSGLLGTFLTDSFTDSQYIIGLGALTSMVLTGYIYYKDSKKKVERTDYQCPAIMKMR